jgi:hypothetical protein
MTCLSWTFPAAPGKPPPSDPGLRSLTVRPDPTRRGTKSSRSRDTDLVDKLDGAAVWDTGVGRKLDSATRVPAQCPSAERPRRASSF